MKDKTRLIRTQTDRTSYREHNTPLYLTSSFTFDSAEQMRDTFSNDLSGQIYSRYSNPNLDEFIGKMCILEEKPAGFATSSGMSAVYLGLMSFLNTGDHILASCALFGSTHQILDQILPRLGITTTYVDPENTEEWASAVREETRLMIVETPSNPGLKIIDLEFCGRFCKEHDILFIVDNCFATPILQKPNQYGSQLIIHSATKYIDGQGRVLGGIIVGDEVEMDQVIFFARHTGPVMSPYHAWMLSKSLETLPIRMRAHSENALIVAEKLQEHHQVNAVSYPFLKSFPHYALARKQMTMGGGIVTFELNGDVSSVYKFINGLRMLSITSNLGDTRSIVTHPATTTHSKMDPADRLNAGISDQLIRISVGLEDIEDIVEDIEQSLNQL